MTNALKPVMPGDVISSNFINDLVESLDGLNDRLNQLEGDIGSGTQIVPNLFGHTLFQAKATLSAVSVGLNLGRVIDAYAQIVDRNLPASQSRIVIGQVPSAGWKVSVGSAVDLLLAIVPESAPQPGPEIDGFSNVSTPIKEQVVIIGKNFNTTAVNNTVTFIDVATPVLTSTSTSLLVRVPDGIPGAPTAPGEILPVTVRVVTPYGVATGEHNITAPLAGEIPVITGIDISPFPSAVVGEALEIQGRDFSSINIQNQVKFGSTTTTPDSSSPTALTVTVPSLPELAQPGSFAFLDVVVIVNGRPSDPWPDLFIQNPES